ncbi:MAG: hypothetical protein ACRC62_32455 [Microcoleus sp.]
MHSKITTPAFPPAATAKLLTQKEDGTIESKQSCWGKLALLSNECGSPKEPSETSTRDRPPPTLSGLVISFGKTLPYLASKTVTRRAWKDSHASKFANAFDRQKLIQAFDKDRRYGGKQIGWCRLLSAPYKERLSAMPDEDLIAEGGMCSTVEEFVKRYFKGDSSLEVWVIRFEFVPLGVYPALENQTNTNSPIHTGSESIHQTSLVPLGVYPAPEKQTNTNFPIYTRSESIHQTESAFLGVYQPSETQTNINSPIHPPIESLHQGLSTESQTTLSENTDASPAVQGGSGLVYSFWKGESIVNHYRYKVKIGGKWKVKSIYIPVGKLPQVKEAIANKSGVTAIVVEILGKKV